MFDLIFHVDQHISSLIQSFGPWSLVILFVIVFCETGLVVTPFLPGDSLLFAVGAVSAMEPVQLPIVRVLLVLLAAATLGDSVNAELGRRAGTKISAWIERRPSGAQHLDAARTFFVTHGGRAVVLARFLPLLRTFVPFIAGIAGMPRSRFFLFNVVGAVVWVGSLTMLGYAFGNLPAVKSQFHLVIIGIIVLSLAPLLFRVAASFFEKRKTSKGGV